MSEHLSDPRQRAENYARSRGLELQPNLLGKGKDGHVWATTARSAVKVHERVESYRAELAAYIRLKGWQVEEIAGFNIPLLLDHDDNLFVLEIGVVFPPFIVDFASARLDVDPQLIEDEGNTLEDFVRSRFDDHTDEVMGIYYELIAKAGIYLTDLHPHNIKFE